jgi:hypothetical protein
MALVELCNRVVDSGKVDANDVLALRREVFGQIAVTREEVDLLFRIDEQIPTPSTEWHAFFVEALTDWLVRQQEPAGYVTVEQAEWLIARIDQDRRLRRDSEIEVVLRVLELADEAPPELSAFGLSLISRSLVASGASIAAADVDAMRRLVFALSGPGSVSVTKEEADALFDLNDQTRGLANDPAWTDFFKRAVANAVTAAAGWTAPDRAKAMSREVWLEAPEASPLGLVGQALRSVGGLTPSFIRNALFGDDMAEFNAHLERREAAARDALPVSQDEAAWLLARIGRDKEFDVNEKALVSFLRDLSPTMHPSLAPLIARLDA